MAANTTEVMDSDFDLQFFLNLAEEHVTKYKEIEKAGRELLDAIAILSQRRVPRTFPNF